MRIKESINVSHSLPGVTLFLGNTSFRYDPLQDRAALLIVDHRLRRRAAYLDLRGHSLQARSKRFKLLLLVRGSRLEVLLLLRYRGL